MSIVLFQRTQIWEETNLRRNKFEKKQIFLWKRVSFRKKTMDEQNGWFRDKVSKFPFNFFRENFFQPTKMFTKTKIFVKLLLQNSQNSFEILDLLFKILFFSQRFNLFKAKWKNFDFYWSKIEWKFRRIFIEIR